MTLRFVRSNRCFTAIWSTTWPARRSERSPTSSGAKICGSAFRTSVSVSRPPLRRSFQESTFANDVTNEHEYWRPASSFVARWRCGAEHSGARRAVLVPRRVLRSGVVGGVDGVHRPLLLQHVTGDREASRGAARGRHRCRQDGDH